MADHGRLLGVDYGEARIGLAISDPTGLIATPIEAIKAAGAADAANIARVAVEQEARGIVVGLPLSLDGSQGPAARKVNAFCDRLRKATDLSVITWDERMTTVEAHSLLREAGKSPSKARGAARGKIDSASAAIILDSYMQSN
ncbi:Holliday junction resolvase RuvX [Candidatus Lucifugimonas marina]|uniref:Putative pre-16S rRNA nuclease n=1 Tax=Candidatus Lucifugimonas marina TaxID=3038979 RepID=A0AAJ5ZDT4_9CHLR|nr:Holliday junction resolvase RuvX [SAR202 cluster bacterium JH702]MDG0868775.1 Holliday junction resolvase RuvX [SAR202 cluster bacterium JH639]WFG35407.1 Holliday junction resolvase RuvX [SAR202 cluster bacterium JH545]WFG39354.1 Holliday junction resolvase RuvX [SAR202 cluster bacterium JH1073]